MQKYFDETVVMAMCHWDVGPDGVLSAHGAGSHSTPDLHNSTQGESEPL